VGRNLGIGRSFAQSRDEEFGPAVHKAFILREFLGLLKWSLSET
jgi:hypothetical protein